ncbi:hypothetical protein K0H71_15215 [Bacillus sp. IITD106]|nr:hypothetical protein [Bacillus sp. IITD106]
MYYAEGNIKKAINKAFQDHKVNNPELEEALAASFVNILSDSSVIKYLTENITELQKFNEDRMRHF